MKLEKENVRFILIIIGTLALAVLGLIYFGAIMGFIGKILTVLSPFFGGFCVAFVVNELLKPLEWLFDKAENVVKAKRGKSAKKTALRPKARENAVKKAGAKKKCPASAPSSPEVTARVNRAKRPICLTLSFLIVISAITALFFIIIPEIKNTVTLISTSMPEYAEKAEEWFESVRAFLERHSIDVPDLGIDIDSIISKAGKFLSEQGTVIFDRTINATTSVFSGIVNGFLALVFAVYLLAGKEKLIGQTKKVLSVLLPKRAYDKTLDILVLTNKTFSSFISGQVTEAVILGFLCFVGMVIFRMDYAGPISALVGFTALIPMFGAFIGTVVGAFLILFVNPVEALWFIVYIQILQQIEGNFIYPKVVGKSVGLPGIWVLFAVTVGGGAAGIIGMLVGVPICSVLYTLARGYINSHTRTADNAK